MPSPTVSAPIHQQAPQSLDASNASTCPSGGRTRTSVCCMATNVCHAFKQACHPHPMPNPVIPKTKADNISVQACRDFTSPAGRIGGVMRLHKQTWTCAHHRVLHHGPVALIEPIHARVALAGGATTQELHLSRHWQLCQIFLRQCFGALLGLRWHHVLATAARQTDAALMLVYSIWRVEHAKHGILPCMS